jgi:DNA-directed RNA polymerase specialized sigma subunit
LPDFSGPLPVCIPLEGRVERTAAVAQDPIAGLNVAAAARLLAMLASTLTGTQLAVVRLRYYDELTFHDIGVRLGVSTGSAYRLHQRALLALRKRLEDANIRRLNDLI